MKLIKVLSLCLFALVILIPLALFNFEEGAVSEIDNRVLTGNPLNAEGDLTKNTESYVNDRIGLRNEMILAYTVLNDRLFGQMEHPSYSYGKEGYVFGNGLFVSESYRLYHQAFADMVKSLQDYCDARQIPFLFVFDPAKPAVLTEYIPDGYNYDRSWVDGFLAALDARGVRYLDNTVTLREKHRAGEVVFNQKYDANHWNDLGAYYGANAILAEMQKDIPGVHVIHKDELTVGQRLMTSLPVSKFPIEEQVPAISMDAGFVAQHDRYTNELERHPSYPYFAYYTNQARLDAGAPRALVFQGSYMITFGEKYLAAGFGEYIAVHDYQNVMDIDYYMNIFQPDCVIFEVAEYTFYEKYFSSTAMDAMDLNPTLEQAVSAAPATQSSALEADSLTVQKGETLTKITWATEETAHYAWLSLDTAYDMRAVDGGWEVTVHTSTYEACADSLVIHTQTENTFTQYKKDLQ